MEWRERERGLGTLPPAWYLWREGFIVGSVFPAREDGHVVWHAHRSPHLLAADFLLSTRTTYPAPQTIKPGEVVLVEDAGVRKWACLLCPGGCGATLSLSLNPGRRPCWRIEWDFWLRPTIEPSIHHQIERSSCHFWIKKGRLIWCDDRAKIICHRERQPEAGRRECMGNSHLGDRVNLDDAKRLVEAIAQEACHGRYIPAR